VAFLFVQSLGMVDFQNKTKACRNTLFDHLKKAADTGLWQKRQSAIEATGAWEKEILDIDSQSSKQLEFHLFHMPFAEILSKGLNLKKMGPQETSTPNTILAILK